MIIDIYSHIFPTGFYNKMTEIAPNLANLGKRLKNVKLLHDLDERFKKMDAFGDYRQVLSLPNPPIEAISSPDLGPELAKIGNDSMAELVEKHPDRFPAFVAALSLNNLEAAMDELHRAIKDLGARGIQMFTNVNGRPLDDPEFEPLFEAMAEHDLPIWMHPARTANTSDYDTEPRSRFELWWCFGWPYDTSIAMARLVFSGLFDRYPGIKILTHHLGGMIPYFDGRVGAGLEVLGSRTTDEDYSDVLSSLKRPHLEYFKMFFGDTALFGAVIGLKCGLEFFGRDHVVFATDAPFAPVEKTIAAIEQLELTEADKKQIYHRNAEKLMNVSFD